MALLNPPLKETELIQRLIAQALSHDGYVDTARAFATEVHEDSLALSTNTGAAVTDLDPKEDEDAINRQSMSGHIIV